MVFQKKGGPSAKRSFPQQMNEKIQKKKQLEVEDEDDDDSDDITMEDDSEFDDSDSDASDSGGKLITKGMQTPTQAKGSPFIQSAQRQAQMGKRNQLQSTAQKKQEQQNKNQFSGTKSPGKGKMVDREAVEVDEEEDSDDDDDEDDDSDDVGKGKLNAKGKQTPQGKGQSLVKSPRGQAQTPVLLASGKKGQLPVSQKQVKQSALKEVSAVKGSAGKGKILGKDEDDEDDDDEDDDDEDDIDDDDSDSGDVNVSKLSGKGKQTPTQGKGSALIKTSKGQVEIPGQFFGKKSQPSSQIQKQGKKNALKEFPGMKGIAGKGQSVDRKDDSDDDDESEDDDSDNEVKQKTPTISKLAGNKTANGKKGMHVSFELPKKAGSPAKTPKSQENAATQGKKNQQIPVASGVHQGKSAKQGATKGALDSSMLKAQKKKDEESDDDDLGDNDDLDDDDLSEEDDSDLDDDDDSDDEDIKKKLASIKKEIKANEANKNAREPKKAKVQLTNKQIPDGKEANKSVSNEAFQECFEKEVQSKRQRDARNLFVGSLPLDITTDELKALSPDIVNVNLPRPKFGKKRRTQFAFLEFANEKKAEENYEKLQKKTLRGQKLFIDFSGEKSKNQQVAASCTKEKDVDKKQLCVLGLPTDTTMLQVAQVFPRSLQIRLNKAHEHRSCYALFETEEDAAQAFKESANAMINGKRITVSYFVKTDVNRKRKGPGFGKNKFTPHKKMRKDM